MSYYSDIIDRYYLEIVCVDGGIPERKTTRQISVDVIDDNDNHPTFSKARYTTEISENNVVPSKLIKLPVSDEDTGDNSRISFFIANVFYNYTKKNLYTKISNSKLHKSLKSNFTQYIFTTPPQVSKSRDFLNSLQINETFKFSTEITNAFSIDVDSGVLQANIRLNREEMASCLVTVVARDNGKDKRHSSSALVEILIKDENDQKPSFDQPEYFFSTLESTEPGRIIGAVFAYDEDQFPYNIFYYRIRKYTASLENVYKKATKLFEKHSDKESASRTQINVAQMIIKTDSNMFSIDSTSGEIIVNFSLDKEKTDMYVFRVEVVENVDDESIFNNNVATATVYVRIDDVNDHSPIFVYPPPQINFKLYKNTNTSKPEHSTKIQTNIIDTIKNKTDSGKSKVDATEENFPQITIGWVLAVDQDVAVSNSKVVYALTDCLPLSNIPSNSLRVNKFDTNDIALKKENANEKAVKKNDKHMTNLHERKKANSISKVDQNGLPHNVTSKKNRNIGRKIFKLLFIQMQFSYKKFFLNI